MICVDLDGTIARYSGYKGASVIGDPYPGAVEFVRDLDRLAGPVVIHSVRALEEYPAGLFAIRDWLKRHGLRTCSIHTGTGKPNALAFIDDRAVTCRPSLTDRDHAVREYARALEQVKALMR